MTKIEEIKELIISATKILSLISQIKLVALLELATFGEAKITKSIWIRVGLVGHLKLTN